MNTDTEADAMDALLSDWFELRDWAAELLTTTFGFDGPREILDTQNRGNEPIPGTDWFYRTHGIGVEVYQARGRAVDFDFAFPSPGFEIPDPWRLRWFAEAEIRAKRPMADAYRAILRDEKRFDAIAKAAITSHQNRGANKAS